MNFLEAAIGGSNCRVSVVRAKEEEVKKDTEMELDQTKVSRSLSSPLTSLSAKGLLLSDRRIQREAESGGEDEEGHHKRDVL